MGTIEFSCSPGAVCDNMLPANASEKLRANSYKEGMDDEGWEGEIHDSCNLVICETRLFGVYKIVDIWVSGENLSSAFTFNYNLQKCKSLCMRFFFFSISLGYI